MSDGDQVSILWGSPITILEKGLQPNHHYPLLQGLEYTQHMYYIIYITFLVSLS